MAHSKDDPEVFWVRPEERGVFPLDGFHVSRSLSRTILKAEPKVRLNSCFGDVVTACANRSETWISQRIYDLYLELHALGYAHSVEVFDDQNRLWGGVYGVALGGAFFGESMFSAARDGSKIALTCLIARLRYGGFILFDTQFVTDHLASLGAIEIPRRDYEDRLKAALSVAADIHALPEDQDASSILQLTTQTS